MNEPTTCELVRPASAPLSTPRGPINYALLELLAKWRAEDATDDPEQIRLAEQELDEFMNALNRNRIESGEPPLFP